MRTDVEHDSCFTSDFLLAVVVVAAREERAEDEAGNIHLLVLVYNHRNALAVVPDLDHVFFSVEEHSNTRNVAKTVTVNAHGLISILMQFIPFGSLCLLSAALVKFE